MTADPDHARHRRHEDHRRMHEPVWTRKQALALLDAPERRLSENPEELWKRSGLRRGMAVVDVGAGTGYFAFPASDIVGDSGTVYAVDVSRVLVRLLRERARHRTNVVVRLSRPDRIPLPDGIADRVLLSNVLHGIPPATVEESVRVLRPGGRLLDLDWKKATTARGPPVEHRLSAHEAREVLEQHGLRFVRSGPLGPSHYLAILTKPND
jgi:ubiquinone/menaquinone biosynthesis C-methylase UbiE